jgi:hypothetical protein
MSSPKSIVWKDAPQISVPDLKSLHWDSGDLWLCYDIAQASEPRYAIVRFIHVIDHRLSPINDEGLGKHPCFKSGLQFYAFNEITGSAETVRWSVLRARHWVVTFKDDTLDVIAQDAKVIARDLVANSPTTALFQFMTQKPA